VILSSPNDVSLPGSLKMPVSNVMLVFVFGIYVFGGCTSNANITRDREAMKSILRSRVGLEMRTPEIDANIRELAVEDDWYLMKVAKPVLLDLFNTEEFYKLCPKLRQGPCLKNTPFEISSLLQRESLADIHVRPTIEYIKQYGMNKDQKP